MYEESNRLTPGVTSFWQIYSVFDVAYALGVSIGPFFAGLAASGHVATHAGEHAGQSKWAHQCMGVMFAVLTFSILLAFARRNLPEPGSPEPSRIGGYNPVKTKDSEISDYTVADNGAYQSSLGDSAL